jgi:hypothetical protein
LQAVLILKRTTALTRKEALPQLEQQPSPLQQAQAALVALVAVSVHLAGLLPHSWTLQLMISESSECATRTLKLI